METTQASISVLVRIDVLVTLAGVEPEESQVPGGHLDLATPASFYRPAAGSVSDQRPGLMTCNLRRLSFKLFRFLVKLRKVHPENYGL